MNKRSTRRPKKAQDALSHDGTAYTWPELTPTQKSIVTTYVDGMIKEDEDSPSGYSMYKLGQWIPLVPKGISKKKKKKQKILRILADEEAQAKAVEEKRKRDLEAENQRFIDYLRAPDWDRKITIIYSGFGYSVVALKRKMTLQISNEKSAFQPYEKTEERCFHVVEMLRWGTPLEWDIISTRLMNDDVKMTLISSVKDIDEWIEHG